ncbi:MAG TPA: isoprenylcysteine carboxylmethyltransferase family protein [Anaerolineae bacterium]|nr:isoprenylcysteine carboxylmethyltransferase family protein [Anaerolineae bacterium]
MTQDTVFRLIIFVVVVVSLAISIHYRRKANRASSERISRREEGVPLLVLLRLAGLSVWLSLLTYLINPAWVAWAALALPLELRWLGAGFSLTALPLVFWMFHSLGHNVTDTVAIRQRHTLVMHGPYRWIRHPLYSFGSLLFVGIGLMAANGLLLATMGIAFPLLVIRTPIEEAKLIEHFGNEYRAYMQQTGRFLPRLTRPTS